MTYPVEDQVIPFGVILHIHVATGHKVSESGYDRDIYESRIGVQALVKFPQGSELCITSGRSFYIVEYAASLKGVDKRCVPVSPSLTTDEQIVVAAPTEPGYVVLQIWAQTSAGRALGLPVTRGLYIESG